LSTSSWRACDHALYCLYGIARGGPQYCLRRYIKMLTGPTFQAILNIYKLIPMVRSPAARGMPGGMYWRGFGWDLDRVGTVDIRFDLVAETVWLEGVLFGRPYSLPLVLEDTCRGSRALRCPSCGSRMGRPPMLHGMAVDDGLVFGCSACQPLPEDAGPTPVEVRQALAGRGRMK
jgi:hypothetical protein